MKADCESIPYNKTGFFSKLIIDYLHQDAGLQAFYKHAPTMEGINESIKARQLFNQDRELLYSVLKEQYNGLEITKAVSSNMELLREQYTFTITTAHQPNILTGPLYFIYKILHVIKLAAKLKEHYPQYKFVPVFYMGSEDADLDELGHIFINGEKVEWQTEQQGAVGRMRTKGIEKMIDRLEGEFGGLPFGKEMANLCRQAYSGNNNIQQATLALVNGLFKDYGLIIIIPDNAKLKTIFNGVVKKELLSQFSHSLVQETIEKMGEKYKVQAGGRAINLFYLGDDGSRDRVELMQPPRPGSINTTDDEREFMVVNKGISFTKQAILAELEAHPERFSANVILRGVFQETILPNIAFIGGGGEIAYWMELKKVFEAAGVPFPVLLLRNSFLLIAPGQKQIQQKLAITSKELFLKEDALINELVRRITNNRLETKPEQDIAYSLYENLQELASAIDPTLKAHVAALHVRTLKGLLELEKKFLRAEKRKQEAIVGQVQKLHGALFPNGNLQERIENFMPLYARYGKAILTLLYQYSEPLANNFTVLSIEEAGN